MVVDSYSLRVNVKVGICGGGWCWCCYLEGFAGDAQLLLLSPSQGGAKRETRLKITFSNTCPHIDLSKMLSTNYPSLVSNFIFKKLTLVIGLHPA